MWPFKLPPTPNFDAAAAEMNRKKDGRTKSGFANPAKAPPTINTESREQMQILEDEELGRKPKPAVKGR